MTPTPLVATFGCLLLTLTMPPIARADAVEPRSEPPQPLAIGQPSARTGGDPIERGRRPGVAEGSGLWFGTVGAAFVLVLLGALTLATRRLGRGRTAGALHVVDRANLSPKHAVHLLRVGDRVLILGTGVQGPPALLGELTEPADRDRFLPPTDKPEPEPVPVPLDRDHAGGNT